MQRSPEHEQIRVKIAQDSLMLCSLGHEKIRVKIRHRIGQPHAVQSWA
jgi:hypothetical protein